MYDHHRESIANLTIKLKADRRVRALIIAGSIAHGFAGEDADIDVMIVVSNGEYRRRRRERRELFRDEESCTYPGGYVDGKCVSVGFIRRVARSGGEPARFAFKDASIAFSRIPGLGRLLQKAAQYPAAFQAARLRRLYARFLEWSWFFDEAVKKNNPYLRQAAVANTVLYGGRAVLAHNGILYPFHKWFLKILEGAPEKPPALMALIDDALASRSPEAVERFRAAIKGFRDWGVADADWAACLTAGEAIGCPESAL